MFNIIYFSLSVGLHSTFAQQTTRLAPQTTSFAEIQGTSQLHQMLSRLVNIRGSARVTFESRSKSVKGQSQGQVNGLGEETVLVREWRYLIAIRY